MTHFFQLVLPAMWLGLVVALSFIETPLKFRVPGMTLRVALALGRRVFTAANIAGGLLLIALTAATTQGATTAQWWVLGGLWVVWTLEVAVLRPVLAVRTNARIAGDNRNRSRSHLLYVAADTALVGLLVTYLVVAA